MFVIEIKTFVASSQFLAFILRKTIDTILGFFEFKDIFWIEDFFFYINKEQFLDEYVEDTCIEFWK